MVFPFIKTLELTMLEYERGEPVLHFLLMRDWDECALNVSDQLPLAPLHSEHLKKKKRISCPSTGEREPLFRGTMEGILLWSIASHSISQCCGVAAERGQQGWRRNSTLTLQTSQALRRWLCLQLTSSAHLCWPVVKRRVRCYNVFRWGCNEQFVAVRKVNCTG